MASQLFQRRTKTRFAAIGVLAHLESENLQKNIRRFAHLASVNDEVVELYKLFDAIRERQGISHLRSDALAIFLALTVQCRRSHVQAVITCLRGNPTDSYLFTRKGTEMAAIARLVERDPDLAQLWASAASSDVEYRQYKDSVGAKALFPNDHPVLAKLYGAYDACSKRSHPSVHSLGGNIDIQVSDTSLSVSVRHLEDEDGVDIEGTILWTCYVHGLILDVLAETARMTQSSKGSVWETYRGKLDATLVKLIDPSTGAHSDGAGE